MIRQILKNTLIFFAFLVITGVCSYLALTYFIRNEDSVVVPELAGKEVVQVLEMLSGLGLNTKVTGTEYSSLIPRNHVIFQDPEPGTIIKKNRDVRIVFSKGPQTVFVPPLSRQKLPEAQRLLSEKGLTPGHLVRVYHEDMLEDTIISQYPEPGEACERGSAVDLLISRGKLPRAFVMDDLRGKDIDEAIRSIGRRHLTVGTITGVSLPRTPLNVITEHDPPPGSRITEGATVNLSINRQQGGKDRIYEADAGARLFRYTLGQGFLKKQIRAQMSCDGSVYEVYNQEARPGEEIWIMVPVNSEATVFLYEDGDLVQTRFYD
jgi:serine/threonine-protein kinase